ncbi:unnamed protein product [Penicillium camemberti]|uniref:Str. FM013 n=1 Tax=Penicillium camemberti (strain FM 013) TaxID=1429867 RepID=A0A0G4NZN1_PENC3|nr:unnamed protein product [Penicillium camemberti]
MSTARTKRDYTQVEAASILSAMKGSKLRRTALPHLVYKARIQEIVMDKKAFDTRDLLESFRAMIRDIGVPTVTSTNARKSALSTWQGH